MSRLELGARRAERESAEDMPLRTSQGPRGAPSPCRRKKLVRDVQMPSAQRQPLDHESARELYVKYVLRNLSAYYV
jgi:hypothetical protein